MAKRARADQWLAVVSAAQLTFGISGMVVAVKRHRAYDFLFCTVIGTT